MALCGRDQAGNVKRSTYPLTLWEEEPYQRTEPGTFAIRSLVPASIVGLVSSPDFARSITNLRLIHSHWLAFILSSNAMSLAILALLSAGAYAQQAGTLTAENHPKISTQKCTASGCTSQQNSVVLDANWRWVHSTSGSTNCYTGQTWDKTLCPDATTCAANCALDGGDYEGTYGISASGNSLSLTLVTGSNVGSRVYLMDTTDAKYQEFNLKNQEFTFDVDVSNLPCGLNGALYFVSMDADGGMARFPTNKAGAKYGTGYCDSQCPQDIKFINGQVGL